MSLADRLFRTAFVERCLEKIAPHLRADDRPMQILLAERYRDLARQGAPLPAFADVEFSRHSQNGEDGILLFLFSVLGTTNRQAVELGAGDGVECNTANLVINHGWRGLLVGGSGGNIAAGRKFYARRTNAWRLRRLPPDLVQAWIERESVNALVLQHGVAGSVDLLSLDVDGMDYWIWEALTAIEPRVVVLEYNNRWAAHQACTVPYARAFVGEGASEHGDGYFGASLRAFEILGRRKGYRLVGANSPNTNAFFLRHDVGADLFPAVTVESCLASDYARHQHAVHYPAIAGRPVVEVG